MPCRSHLSKSAKRRLLVVHGHRVGNAPGGRASISEECVVRVRRAERAARSESIDFVLFSGAGMAGHPSEALQMAMLWQGPRLRAYLDERSTDTAENVEQTLLWARKLGATDLLVVSSWWHLRLFGLYNRRRCCGVRVRHARAWRFDDVFGHLMRELRGLPMLWRRRRVETERVLSLESARATRATGQEA
jgi:uncharacterized SAM-binding protein YcdF (DUF218 family)